MYDGTKLTLYFSNFGDFSKKKKENDGTLNSFSSIKKIITEYL